MYVFLCLRAVKSLARLHGCACSSEPLLLGGAINTKVSYVLAELTFKICHVKNANVVADVKQ